MESQGSCIRNELFTKKIEKVEKKRGKSDSLSEGVTRKWGGGGTEERLCWCITLYTSYILIGSAMFQYFFPLLQLLTCILWSRLTDWCTHSNQVFLPEQIFPTGKIKINKMNVKSLQTDWTSDNAITPKIVCFSSRIFHEDLGQYLEQARTSRNPTRPSTLNVFEIRGPRDRESIVGSRYMYALGMLGITLML